MILNSDSETHPITLKILSPVGEKSKRDGSVGMKMIQWWGFIAIVKDEIKVRVVVRKVGEGHIHFWSVIPYSTMKRNNGQKLFTIGLEDDQENKNTALAVSLLCLPSA